LKIRGLSYSHLGSRHRRPRGTACERPLKQQGCASRLQPWSRKEVLEFEDINANIQRKMEFANGKKDVVDPEVRAYVSSLVTAVSIQIIVNYRSLTRSSLEEVVLTKKDDTYLETMPLHVCEILRDG
jgi:hypothetical protein